MEQSVLKEALKTNYAVSSSLVTKDQIGDKLFAEWKSKIKILYSLGKNINKKTCLMNELQAESERAEIYDIISQLYEMIGPVNGYPLFKAHNLHHLVAAYASKNDKNGFRRAFERFLSREIVVQELKTQKMLEEEEEIFQLIRGFRRKMAKRKKQQNQCENLNKEPIPSESNEQELIPEKKVVPPVEIQFASFVVLCNAFKCNKNHKIEPIRAVVEIIDSLGRTRKQQIAAGYCRECEIFFLLETDFKNVRSQGVLLCQVVSHKTYIKNSKTVMNGVELKAESVLHQSGYNVNAADNLTSVQRQEILSRVIDNHLYSIAGLLSFLDWLIERNKKVITKNMGSALKKWEEDRVFVANYKSDAQRQVKVNVIDAKR